ncbi:MAG: hypothetical protein BZY88_17700 [SAR202 cluster bacterium Io17-Chloro-G9]|nr:MAG: hypothetical protein BZY88_17700 [SAR202 cluster bacterium Io17-Chloro-G9]
MALGWAIISAGAHPNNNIAPALNSVDSEDLVAVYSRDQGRAEAFAEKHGAKAAYDDLDLLLADTRVDAVFIASPNSLHAQHGLKAASAGKHVMMEKPMTTTLEDAVALVRGCRVAGVRLGMAFMMRHHPGHVLASEIVKQGTLGKVNLAHVQAGPGVRGQGPPPPRTGLQAWWEDPVQIGGASVMMGIGVHLADLLRFVLNQEVTEVSAMSDGQTDEQPLEHMTTLLLRFDRGTIATLTCGRMIPDNRNDLVLYGVDGRLATQRTVGAPLQGKVEVVSEKLNQTQVYTQGRFGNFSRQLVEFHQAIEEGRDPSASGIDGLRVVEITLAMIESARHGRTVKIQHQEV